MPKLTEKEYFELRSELVEKNQNYIGVVLSDEEKKLDARLTKLVEDCKAQFKGNIPCDEPIVKTPDIWRTKLYSFCKALPKGADLHVHGTSLVPVWRLIEFLRGRDDILIDPETLILHLPKENANGCIPISEALGDGTVDRIMLERRWTVRGISEGENVWRYFEDLFSYHAAIDCDMKILYDYYMMAFEYCIQNGIFHVELHVLLSSDLDETLEIVRCIRKAYYDSRKKYPELCARVIGSGMKMFDYSLDETGNVFANTVKAHETVKDEFDGDAQNFVVGFDLINEEDTSRSLKEYAPMLLKLSEHYPDFHFFLHCGESLDSRNDNLIDAYLLGSKRVGHGMNLYRYPDLLRRYVGDEICLEVCPISNQTLNYIRDLRSHPAAEYLKRGVTVALCSDDPVYQEHEQLTDDFFAAICAWGLGIAEIKQLCVNSILYSELDEKNKSRLIKHWKKAWDAFILKQNSQNG